MDIFRTDSIAADLTMLPSQPADVAWPVERWPRGELNSIDEERTRRCLNRAFELEPGEGVTYALVIVQGGRLVFERYEHGANENYLQYSWSMAKSITHALVGLAAQQGRLSIYDPMPVPEWQGDGDPRRAITWHDMLRMRDGLGFVEDYVDGGVSDVIAMLFGDGRLDAGAYAAAKPLAYAPGTRFNYSSGTTNIICRALARIVGGGPTGMLQFMQEQLFEPLGMRTPTPRFDNAGTFIGSSFLLATPHDFARFGLLYLRGGAWAKSQLLPRAWIDFARTPSYQDDEQGYGAHWWLHPSRSGWFMASGYDGQRILLVPDKDLVIVRLGRTDAEHAPSIWANLDALVDSLPAAR